VKGRISTLSWMLSVVFAALGALTCLALLQTLQGRESLVALPGQFLFSTFLWSSFFIPAYLFVLSGFLLSRRFSPWGILFLNLFLLPFLTTSVFHKVLLGDRIPGSYLPDLLVENLGRVPSAALLFLLILLELFGIVAVRRARARRREGGFEVVEGPRNAAAEPVAAVEAQAGRAGRGKRREQLSAEEPGDTRRRAVEAWIEDGEPEPAIAPVRDRAKRPSGKASPSAGKPPREVRRLPERSSPEEVDAPPAKGTAGRRYELPVKGLLKDYPDGDYWEIDEETRRAAEVLMATLEEFKISAEVTGIRKGPVITMFEILPSPGVKISRIVTLSDNIALRLAASRVRIVAPIPGKHAVGIEVPNRRRAIVSFKEMVTLKEFQGSRMEVPIALGKGISGEPQFLDLVQTPHLLIAGATGSGKSVCVNSIICSILYGKSPEEVRFILIDPKIVELKAYNDIPHLLTPVVTEPKRAFQVLQYCIEEMERRYSMLDYTGVRDIRGYNRKAAKQKLTIQHLPYWVVVVDEFADLIATTGKEMEAVLARLAAMARAVGIHLVLATQRPSIDVITGLIKANIPSRIAFMVASKFDSRIIIDAVGAEKLLGQGDMLFCPAWDPIPARIQGTYLSDEEVEAITAHARTLGEPEYLDEAIFSDEEEEWSGEGSEDPLMDKALEIVLAAGKASASYLQRRLKVGYNRAARLVEEMERLGIVGPAQGSKPREILHMPER
jgi:DNA segregation ATPase FtsK/SpoIIIE-like protein